MVEHGTIIGAETVCYLALFQVRVRLALNEARLWKAGYWRITTFEGGPITEERQWPMG